MLGSLMHSLDEDLAALQRAGFQLDSPDEDQTGPSPLVTGGAADLEVKLCPTCTAADLAVWADDPMCRRPRDRSYSIRPIADTVARDFSGVEC
jgi:hypothetical protein